MRLETDSAGPVAAACRQSRPALKSGACVVVAEFEVQPSALEAFIDLARRFAEDCLGNEPGCLQFDVVRLDSTPNAVLFHEAYVDAAAFEVHCASAHLARFKAAFPPLIRGEQPLRKGTT